MSCENDQGAMKLSRRSLAKGIACGAVVAALPEMARSAVRHSDLADGTSQLQQASQAWALVMPGIWRIRFGSPEAFTPITTRCIPPAQQGLEALASPATLLSSIAMTSS